MALHVGDSRTNLQSMDEGLETSSVTAGQTQAMVPTKEQALLKQYQLQLLP